MTETVNPTKRFNDIVTVDHISAAIRDSSVFGPIGTNGAGKFAFLRLVGGVLEPDGGCITIDRHEVFRNIPAKKRFFYTSDEQYFFDNTTPEEMMRYYRKVYQGFDETRLHKLMGNLGLDEKGKIHTFSEGIKRQVLAICDVCVGTNYLLYDGTFDKLDPVIRRAVKSIFAANMENRNLTPITASHNLRELEDICDHVGLFHKSDILLSKDLDDMKLNIRKVQCVLRPDMKPENLASLGKVNVEQRGGLCTITARGNRGEMETIMTSYELVLFECIPLSLEGTFISEVKMTGYDIKKLIL